MCISNRHILNRKFVIFLLFALASMLGSANFALGHDLSSSSAPRSSLRDKIVHLQDQIVKVALEYVGLDYVPYVWGGSRIGSPEECAECRACVAGKKVPLSKRAGKCSACQRCGMDCSHFVHRVFEDVGLLYPYATSGHFGRSASSTIESFYGFVDVGTDLNLAQPGDVLVYPRHVVILVKSLGADRGDIVHSTRFRSGDFLRLGGFRLDTNQQLKKYRGRLTRILRHRALIEHPDQLSQT